jgi:hypothetical protein
MISSTLGEFVYLLENIVHVDGFHSARKHQVESQTFSTRGRRNNGILRIRDMGSIIDSRNRDTGVDYQAHDHMNTLSTIQIWKYTAKAEGFPFFPFFLRSRQLFFSSLPVFHQTSLAEFG